MFSRKTWLILFVLLFFPHLEHCSWKFNRFTGPKYNDSSKKKLLTRSFFFFIIFSYAYEYDSRSLIIVIYKNLSLFLPMLFCCPQTCIYAQKPFSITYIVQLFTTPSSNINIVIVKCIAYYIHAILRVGRYRK